MFLKTKLFTTCPEAKILLDCWRWESTTLRHHLASRGVSPLRQLKRVVHYGHNNNYNGAWAHLRVSHVKFAELGCSGAAKPTVAQSFLDRIYGLLSWLRVNYQTTSFSPFVLTESLGFIDAND